ncbi:hypothetical protein D3C72_1765770 [compost metagenome]
MRRDESDVESAGEEAGVEQEEARIVQRPAQCDADRASAGNPGKGGRWRRARDDHDCRDRRQSRHAEEHHCLLPAGDADQQLGEGQDGELADRAARIDDSARHRALRLGDQAIRCRHKHCRADRASAGRARHADQQHQHEGIVRDRRCCDRGGKKDRA